MTAIEWVAAVFGVGSVYMGVRQNVWAWPLTIVSVSMYAVVFLDARLYADMGLQAVYVAISLYGWYQWLYGGEAHTPLKVTRLGRRTAIMLGATVIALTAILGTFLFHRTDASIPYVDSTATSVSLAAQWMLTRKILENWLVWIAVDVLYIGMFLYKSLHVTALLYVVYLALCIRGYTEWRSQIGKAELGRSSSS